MPLDALGATPDETEVLTSILAEVRRYGARIDARRIDREKRVPTEILHDLADMGLFGASIPEAYGGAGFSLQGVCALVATLAERDRAVATTVGLHLGLGTRGLVRFGSDALRSRVLPELAGGRRIAAFAATEPGAGSDLNGIATRIEDRGEKIGVRGEKIFVTNGGLADVFTLLCAGLGSARRGMSLVLLERGEVEIGPEEDKLGLKGSSTTSLHVDAEIPADRVIGEPGRGMEHAQHVLAWGRTAMAAGCTGAAKTAIDATLRHIDERKQFGKPLSAFEVVRGQVAGMKALHHAMESIVRWTADAPDDETLAIRSTAAKVLCSEGDWEICDTAVQLHGGSGFIEETGLPLLLRDARITRIFEGANDVLLIHAGTMEAVAPKPRPHAPAAGAIQDAVAARRAELASRFGARLMRQQRLLHGLGRLAVLREAAEAVALRGPGPLTDLWLARVQTALHPHLTDPPVLGDLS